MKERFAEIVTPDGRMEAFVTHPEQDGPFPAVIVYMDVFGLRERLYDVARRIDRRLLRHRAGLLLPRRQAARQFPADKRHWGLADLDKAQEQQARAAARDCPTPWRSRIRGRS